MTLPNKFNIPCPNPAVGFPTLAQPGATLPQSLTQLLVARFLILKVTKISGEIFWDR